MRTILSISCLLLYAAAAGADDLSQAQTILDRYLATPHPRGPSKGDPYNAQADAEVNGARLARLALLGELKATPDAAVSAAEEVLMKRASPVQRYEIVGALGSKIQTRACADLLHRVLQDVREPNDEDSALYEVLVRCEAVHGLRRMSRRTDRTGGQRIERSADLDPAVPGLVPYLVLAADDKAEQVRVTALYALADTRDPVAVLELRKRLDDPSDRVRLYAACFLTEVQDASGLPEMRRALARLCLADPTQDFRFYADVEMLLASMERITGKGFGPIPMNPMLSSSTTQGEANSRRYQALLRAWAQWWDWEPAALDG
ncbi:MAG: HEAT repeat domain-containing protein [Phycisphaerae bacterium]|nr:HEAT repeat domain-containing protein [Phycisphaerae bacterium]